MKPEKSTQAPVLSTQSKNEAIGVPAEWMDPLQKLGYTTIEKLKAVKKSGKLHQEMMGYC